MRKRGGEIKGSIGVIKATIFSSTRYCSFSIIGKKKKVWTLYYCFSSTNARRAGDVGDQARFGKYTFDVK